MSGALSIEWLEDTALGVLRPVDEVTGRPVADAVMIAAPGLTLRRKHSGEVVIVAAPALNAGIDMQIDLRPVGAAYLPRRITLHLPRDADPTHAALPASIFQPALLPLLPAPSYPVAGNVALLRVTVRRSTDSARIGGAVVRLRTAPHATPNARGMTDAAGEALIVVPDLPLASPGPGATLVADVAGQLDVLVDPALVTFVGEADIEAARAAARAKSLGFADPDDIAARLGATAPASIVVRVAPGRVAFATFNWVPA